MPRRGLLVPVTLALAVVTGACAGTSGSPTTSATDVALYEPAGEGGNDAQLAGVLDRTDGCVVVRRDDDASVVVPVLPVGARWEGDELVVGGQRYRVGDRVQWRGGELGGQDTSWLAQVPAGCADQVMWVVHF